MLIDLSKEKLFSDAKLNFEKNISLVFGKNGTGKSTITRLIKEQCNEFDVHIFQGFEGIVDENLHLNAVVLGEENTAINKDIQKLNGIIESEELKKEEIKKKLIEPIDEKENLWTKRNQARELFEKKENEIKDFYKQSAANIKKQNNPQISCVNYDTRNFQKEIENAFLLQHSERKELVELLKSEPKKAQKLYFPQVNLLNILKEVNEILETCVEEKIRIPRIENNIEKRRFAKNGLDIHKSGEICSFCGNVISQKVYSELEKYFSADEVKEFQEKIANYKENINKQKSKIKVQINQEDFYAEYREKLEEIQKCIDDKNMKYMEILNVCYEALSDKLANLFDVSDKVNINLPDDYSKLEEEYNALVIENNKNDLYDKQKKARDKLRYNKIYELLYNFNYYVQVEKEKYLLEKKNEAEQEFLDEELLISGDNGIDSRIVKYKQQIDDLKSKTKNEYKLALNINDKLKHMVSFELVHSNTKDGKGYYQVKSLLTSEIRDITRLSTGEKNIIAFLYFLEKLNEVKEVSVRRKKIIVFDDPMNSNDDSMQYLIIDELQKLIRKIPNDNYLILLTHNNHFYLNVKYGMKYKDNNFIRLNSNGKETTITYIKDENNDFKTSYQALWNEVKFLYYNKSAAAEMLLNPIRRIIETYTKFNVLSLKEFYVEQPGAKKLFDVNSHSIDDLEADLNGKTKQQIIQMLKDCFVSQKAGEHFDKYWG